MEYLPEVNSNGDVIGRDERAVFHSGTKLLHPVVHLHLFDLEGNVILQKRAKDKLIQPGKWDTAVGGHVSYNEKIEDALKREAYEEIGFVLGKSVFYKKYIWETEIERELVYMYYQKNIRIQDLEISDEVEEIKAFTANQISNGSIKQFFTPNLLHELEELRVTRII